MTRAHRPRALSRRARLILWLVALALGSLFWAVFCSILGPLWGTVVLVVWITPLLILLGLGFVLRASATVSTGPSGEQSVTVGGIVLSAPTSSGGNGP
ncbi:hypothetical protein ACFFLM_08285 [Deinococcus oregonensis]|uniref:Uncharacterized protein n=1 Tax=Deinococcus oregonensis TaxID=1805970 RepID=A0ABV6B0G8_9DEIO